jgi:N-methylhydantoinase B/oxoprolinase/acetone carboxylase alpha subunit
MLLTEKRLIPDSGGAGRMRGGLSQRLTFELSWSSIKTPHLQSG